MYDFGWDDSGDHRSDGSCQASSEGWSLEAQVWEIKVSHSKIVDYEDGADRADAIFTLGVNEDDYAEGEEREFSGYVTRDDINFSDRFTIVYEEKNSPWDKLCRRQALSEAETAELKEGIDPKLDPLVQYIR